VRRRSYLLPDITPNAATPELEQQLKQAAVELVKNLSVAEICGRAGLEIVVTIALSYIINFVMKWITDKATKVR
jgi:hypothetical protein